MEEAKKRGLKKGQTNNPKGRPKGSINKTTKAMKELLSEFAEENFEQFRQDYRKLNPEARANIYVKIAMKLTPNAISGEELEAMRQSQGALFLKLFRSENEE